MSLFKPVTVLTPKPLPDPEKKAFQALYLPLRVFTVNHWTPLARSSFTSEGISAKQVAMWRLWLSVDNTIRMHHECEGGIEKSIRRITNWHQENPEYMRLDMVTSFKKIQWRHGSPCSQHANVHFFIFLRAGTGMWDRYKYPTWVQTTKILIWCARTCHDRRYHIMFYTILPHTCIIIETPVTIVKYCFL